MYGSAHIYASWRVASCFSINILDVQRKKPRVATFSCRTISATTSGESGSSSTALQHQAEREGGGQRTTRKRAMDPGSYSEARAYKQRATQEEMTLRRLQPRRRRLGPTATSTDIAKRQRDEMSEIAKTCVEHRRRERFGDG